MQRYKLSHEAKMDLARIYWYGVRAFGEQKADRYYAALLKRFDDIADNPYKYPEVGTFVKAIGAVSAAWKAFTTG